MTLLISGLLCMLLQLCMEHDVPGFIKFKMFDAKRKYNINVWLFLVIITFMKYMSLCCQSMKRSQKEKKSLKIIEFFLRWEV